MIIINIFIAIIIAIGFWRNTSKEHKRKIAKASLTKTVILFLLSVAMTFFYYKSYQVATFQNIIFLVPIKGSYYIVNDTTYDNNGRDTIVEKKICPRDSIRCISLYNIFNHTSIQSFYDSKYSGIATEFQLDNNNGNTSIYPDVSEDKKFEDVKHSYCVSLEVIGIPNLFPFSFFEEYYNKKEIKNTKGFYIERTSPNYHFIRKGDDIYQHFWSEIITTEIGVKEKYTFVTAESYSKYINTLNFFSAADLSQCEYVLMVSSDMPIGTINVNFDLPIIISGLDNIKNYKDNNGFTINYEEQIKKDGILGKYMHYHITFPTLANLQLIRSLILTTLLTALLALFFKNLYYYGRKLYERRKREQKKPFTYSRKMVLLWVPVGKIIVWTFILAFAFLLILSILNYNFRINEESVPLLIFIISISLLLYMILLCGTFYFLYRKGIYIKDLKENLLCKFKKREKVKDDDKPSSKIDEQPAGTIKIEDKPVEATKIESLAEKTTKVEDSKIIENTELKDGQKSSSKLSQPKKGKTRKRKR